jgi:putative acyl-CoA dehydrogenase
MAEHSPPAQRAPHTVANQPPPFEEVNLFTSDRALMEAAAREGGGVHRAQFEAFGALMGSAEVWRLAADAHKHPPELRAFDRYGWRIDEVDFHPAYHAMMRIALEAGISGAPWSGIEGGHLLHAILEFLLAEVEPCVCCPITMTYAAPAALAHAPEIAGAWLPLIVARRYDESSRPWDEKNGITVGMAMTEKQGGSDLRANTTRAERQADGSYRLSGHKWFCSAPMSDGFLTLAQAKGGLTCFLAPRWRPDAQRNAIAVMRLKDKIGDRANASAEIEYRDAYATRLGEEGRGVATILDMVHHTRLDCAIAPAAYMRTALAQALWHVAHRRAFGKLLIDQPLMRAVLADLALESEAATALAMRVARSFDEDGEWENAFSRVGVPVAKYWLNKRVTPHVAECMESHGGAGYVEQWPIARFYRQAPLNGIWEGSGNVICLDVLRALQRTPGARDAFLAEVKGAGGGNGALDAALLDLEARLMKPAVAEPEVRRLVESMALTLQGALLVRHAPAAVSDAFCATRLLRPHLTFGAFDAAVDADAIVKRATPLM